MRVGVDRSRCEGHGLCAAVSPSFYRLDDESFVVVLTEDQVPAALETDAASGADACPVAALWVEEG